VRAEGSAGRVPIAFFNDKKVDLRHHGVGKAVTGVAVLQAPGNAERVGISRKCAQIAFLIGLGQWEAGRGGTAVVDVGLDADEPIGIEGSPAFGQLLG
jgi:hypothetical protein